MSSNRLSSEVGWAIYCSYGGESPVSISNNTIVGSAYGSGIELSNSSPTIVNNIIALNGVGITGDMFWRSAPTVRCNCSYGNGIDYYFVPQPQPEQGNIYDDPRLIGFHLESSSPCRDAGDNDAVASGALDIDGQPRIAPAEGTVDIGADEATGHDLERISLSPEGAIVPPANSILLTARLFDEETENPLEGRRVDFTVSAGGIVSISPDGHLNGPSGSATSGWGTTDEDGHVEITVVAPSEKQKVVVTASTSLAIGRVSRRSELCPAQYKVGFVCELALWEVREYIDEYLTRVDQKHMDVVYERIEAEDITFETLGSFNSVFIALPVEELDPSALNTLYSFIQSGRQKRIVLVGEFNPDYAQENGYLNGIAEGIGMNSKFSTGAQCYDSDLDWCRPCPVNSGHYLTAGVTSLWDAATDTFMSGWEAYARPLAYINCEPTLPWILEEDTATAGSRVAIHDSSMFESCYNDDCDWMPDKNFLFTYNLCTVFPN